MTEESAKTAKRILDAKLSSVYKVEEKQLSKHVIRITDIENEYKSDLKSISRSSSFSVPLALSHCYSVPLALSHQYSVPHAYPCNLRPLQGPSHSLPLFLAIYGHHMAPLTPSRYFSLVLTITRPLSLPPALSRYLWPSHDPSRSLPLFLDWVLKLKFFVIYSYFYLICDILFF